MQEFLKSFLDSSSTPFISALVLGLMTAISPCPLATNITATAFISKNISNKRKVFLSGVIYTLGRAFSYTSIGLILYFGASKFHLARFFNQNGEKYLGPLLVILGLFMLGVFKLHFLRGFDFTQKLSEKFKDNGLWGSFIIGVIFALAFCPYSGVLYFGMLIPLTVASASGLYLPIIFAVGTGIPVIIFTYLLAFAVGSVGLFYNRITQIEKVMRFVAGLVFLLTGFYYMMIYWKVI